MITAGSLPVECSHSDAHKRWIVFERVIGTLLLAGIVTVTLSFFQTPVQTSHSLALVQSYLSVSDKDAAYLVFGAIASGVLIAAVLLSQRKKSILLSCARIVWPLRQRLLPIVVAIVASVAWTVFATLTDTGQHWIASVEAQIGIVSWLLVGCVSSILCAIMFSCTWFLVRT